MKLEEALRLGRQRAGVSQQAIARIWGVSSAYVSLIEIGQSPFPRARIATLDELPAPIPELVREALIAEHEAAIRELKNGNGQ